MVMAPIMPFMMEYIWQNQVREVEKTASLSVMMSGFDIAQFMEENPQYAHVEEITKGHSVEDTLKKL